MPHTQPCTAMHAAIHARTALVVRDRHVMRGDDDARALNDDLGRVRVRLQRRLERVPNHCTAMHTRTHRR